MRNVLDLPYSSVLHYIKTLSSSVSVPLDRGTKETIRGGHASSVQGDVWRPPSPQVIGGFAKSYLLEHAWPGDLAGSSGPPDPHPARGSTGSTRR